MAEEAPEEIAVLKAEIASIETYLHKEVVKVAVAKETKKLENRKAAAKRTITDSGGKRNGKKMARLMK